MTVTVLSLLKRRSGMSKADFIAYYEENHRRIGERVLAGHATRYVRRFLTPMDGEDCDGDFDVVMEIDFPDAAARDAFFAEIAQPDTLAEIVADEEKLFDRNRMRMFSVEERRSQL